MFHYDTGLTWSFQSPSLLFCTSLWARERGGCISICNLAVYCFIICFFVFIYAVFVFLFLWQRILSPDFSIFFFSFFRYFCECMHSPVVFYSHQRYLHVLGTGYSDTCCYRIRIFISQLSIHKLMAVDSNSPGTMLITHQSLLGKEILANNYLSKCKVVFSIS